jgi:segregation and condensation protein A
MIPSNSLPPPSIQFEQFDGPLDLLLDEIRRQNIEIRNVNIAPISARFLEYVRTASQRNLNLNMEWLQMAATMIHWKSQSLLSGGPGAERPHDRIPDDLIRQILAHKQQIADDLAHRRSAVEASFSRGPVPGEDAPTPEEAVEPPMLSVWDMIQQASEMADWVCRHREDRRSAGLTLGVASEETSVAEMMAYLQTRLTAVTGAQLDGLSLLEQQPSVAHRSCLFLAMLEMARGGQLTIEQSENFAPISITCVIR